MLWMGIAKVKPGAYLGDIGMLFSSMLKKPVTAWSVSFADMASVNFPRSASGDALRQTRHHGKTGSWHDFHH
jgi:hypothetical protein